MRKLNKKEEKELIANRNELHEELRELQADLEDFSDEELAEYRYTMLNRINICMELILETDEDNE